MRHHDLKIWPAYYEAVLSGEKTFEIRNNDRDYQPGDIVTLREFDPNSPPNYSSLDEALTSRPGAYTNRRELLFRIGFIYQVDETRVVFSIIPIDEH